MQFIRALTGKIWSVPNYPIQKKKSKTGALIAMNYNGQPRWTPRDYQTFAREGFSENPVVYRCVRMISEAAASVPLVLSDGDIVLNEHPLLDLLNHPNQLQSKNELLEAWYGYLLVSGNSYLEAVSIDHNIRELHTLRPDRMKVIAGRDGWPQAYVYTANGSSVKFNQSDGEGVSPILHMRLFNPSDDHYGQSPIEAASKAIDIHNKSSSWNLALLDNAARPSGALVYNSNNANLSEEQFERLKLELESNFQGAGNAGRPLLLEGGLDWKSMALSPRDMDFIESKHVAAREIALAMGVPPMLLGIPGDNTYSNYTEANRTLWRQTVLPLVTRCLYCISSWLKPEFGASIKLCVDLNKIEALAPERDVLWRRVGDSDFMTINEKRSAVGLSPIDGGDVLENTEETVGKDSAS